jgi:hypothetical protein
LPVTERLADAVLVLPAGSSVGASDVTGVAELIRFALENAPAIRHRLEQRPSA